MPATPTWRPAPALAAAELIGQRIQEAMAGAAKVVDVATIGADAPAVEAAK